MKLLVTGASGMVGTRIRQLAEARGDEVVPLVRRAAREGERYWNPAQGELDPEVFAGIDAVLHLAGDNIGAGRWTTAKKQLIRDSRVKSTQLLASQLAQSSYRPALISASAIGYYGDRGATDLYESASPGKDFLADVCREWEAAADPARQAGVRVVNLRIGVVLSRLGGALASMLFPFRMGVGGNMGDGRQFWSWISLDDVAQIFLYAADQSSLAGPVNAVSPQPVTNAEFTRVLGRVLRRPTFLPMPAFAARIVLGEMADALILSSCKVLPGVLQQRGFEFKHPQLEAALRAALE